MAKEHSRTKYLKLCKKKLEEIAQLPKNEANRPVFEKLRREAQEYLDKAKAARD